MGTDIKIVHTDTSVKLEPGEDDIDNVSSEIQKTEKTEEKLLSAEEQQREVKKRKKREYDKQRRLRRTPEQVKKELETKRLRRVEKTPEQIAEMNRKEAERERVRIASLTPEQFAEMKQKHAERERLRAARQTPEQREKRLERRRLAERERRKRVKEATGETPGKERKRLRRAAETAEAREERQCKERFRRIEKLAKMTDEELKQHKMRKYLANKAYYYMKGRYKDWSKEDKDKSRKHLREWLRNLSGEKRERYLEDSRRRQKERLSKMKQENPEKWRQHQEKLKQYSKRKIEEETPEERIRRHHKYKVNTAARKLKQTLADEQVSEDEIERKMVELKTIMWREFDPDYNRYIRPQIYRGKRRKTTPPPENMLKEADHCNSITISLSVNNDQCNNAAADDAETSLDNCVDMHSHDNTISETRLSDHENVDCGGQFSPYTSPLSSPLPSQSPETITPTHQCLHCPSVFGDDSLLRTHIRAAHADKCWKCPKCKEVVLSPLELSQHYNSSHKTIQIGSSGQKYIEPKSEYRFVCMRCSTNANFHLRNFRTRQNLCSHVKTEHSQHYWPCDYCNLLKYSQKSLKVHQDLCRLFKKAIGSVRSGKPIHYRPNRT